MARTRLAKLDPEVRRRILDAARQEFMAHGFEQASLNAIIERAGISKGVLYYYFEDKADLYLAMVQEFQAFMTNVSGAVQTVEPSGDFWQDMRMLMRHRAAMATQDPEVARLFADLYLLAKKPLDPNPFRDYLEQEGKFAAEILRMGQALGKFRSDVPFEIITDTLFTLSDVLTKQLLIGRPEVTSEDLDRFADLQLDMVRRIADPTYWTA